MSKVGIIFGLILGVILVLLSVISYTYLGFPIEMPFTMIIIYPGFVGILIVIILTYYSLKKK